MKSTGQLKHEFQLYRKYIDLAKTKSGAPDYNKQKEHSPGIMSSSSMTINKIIVKLKKTWK